MAKVCVSVGENELGHGSTIWRNRNRVLQYFLLTFKNFFTSFLVNSHSGTMRISEVYQKHIIIYIKILPAKKEKIKKTHKCFSFDWLLLS